MNYQQIYLDFLRPKLQVAKPVKVVLDASGGAVGPLLEPLFSGVENLDVTLLNTEPDPDFKVNGPNPTLPGATDGVSRKVVEVGADLGVIYDSDGDRAVFLDSAGRRLPSYAATAVLAMAWEQSPRLAVDELVYQSLLQTKLLPAEQLIPGKVGAFNIKNLLKQTGADLGAELSGHYFFKDFFGADSALLATIKMINVISRQAHFLPDFAKVMAEYPLQEVNFKLQQQVDWLTLSLQIKSLGVGRLSAVVGDPVATASRDGLTFNYADGWFNLRPSNTEPLIRFTIQGRPDFLKQCLPVWEEFFAGK